MHTNGAMICFSTFYSMRVALIFFHFISIFAYATFFELNKICEIFFHNANYRSVNRFMCHHNRIFRRVQMLNKFIRQILLSFFLVFYPVNSYLVTLFISTELTFIVRFALLGHIIGQINIIFSIHLLAIAYSRRIHAFVKRMIDVHVHWAKNGQKQNLLSSLKVTNYISKFNVKHQYGLTYSKIGLITLAAFAKVREFLMILLHKKMIE